MVAIKTQTICADFETTTDRNDCRVWAVCAVDVPTHKTVYLSNSIDDFFTWLSNKNTKCYFHNLKFDGEFIISWLLNNGYKFSRISQPMTFSTLVTDDGLFYQITVIFAKENKKYKKVVFLDSLKKLPFKVSQISDAFKLEDKKLHIDYAAYRAPDHELTEEEKQYIVNDCRIVAQALHIQMQQGLHKMTIGSDALNGYKDIIGKNRFSEWFPVLPVELDADIRRAYKGGFTYLNPKYKNKRGLKGCTLDINSLYPSRMHSSSGCMLPFGYPMYFEGEYEPDERYPLYIARIRCAFRLKKGHIPTVQLKNNRAFVETEYLTSSNGEIVEMTLTNVDYQLLLDHYRIDYIEHISGFKFRCALGMFDEYIDYWMHIKETTTGALRQLAKLMLNNLYGKFAVNPHARQKIPFLDENGVVRYELDDPELRQPVYTAMGCFITAYSRDLTIRSAQKLYNRFIYADTDSLHLVGTELPEGIEVHKTKLGAWKHEGNFIDSKFIRAKTYMETMLEVRKDSLKEYAQLLTHPHTVELYREPDGIHAAITHVTCAGMPDNIKYNVTYENFRPDSKFEGKLMPRRCKGGIVLEPTTFTLK